LRSFGPISKSIGREQNFFLQDALAPLREQLNAVSRQLDMHFFVDNATSVPQYLVCKHTAIQFVGLQKVKLGSRATKSSQGGIQLMATKKKAAKKKKKK
ncbi:MAG TPA: hypothetical protein VN872_10510, partial [Candidatus Acidoferrum sp.]|nr:hypothetical protein [Candidatus Acidoferrum sp.]